MQHLNENTIEFSRAELLAVAYIEANAEYQRTFTELLFLAAFAAGVRPIDFDDEFIDYVQRRYWA